MRIGILGSGLMGGKLGTLFARAGHDVVFTYARSDQKLKRLAREARGNARAGTPGEAAREADVLLLAVHWSRVDDVLKQAGDLSGKVIISCSLPMNAADTGLVIGHTSSGAHRAVHAAHRAARVRGRRRPGARLPLRAVRGEGIAATAYGHHRSAYCALTSNSFPAKTQPAPGRLKL